MAEVERFKEWQRWVLLVWAAGRLRPSAPPLGPLGDADALFPESPLQSKILQAEQWE